ncbi:MAG: amidohydrolase family protein [bacterium]|nr:amidohydrolase family protein [bacterium]
MPGLFDFNVAIGRGAHPAGGAFTCAEDLLSEMDRLGIAEALVYHRAAAEADVELGNRLLLEQIEGHSNLHACWVMAPSALGDLPSPSQWVRDAVEHNVRAVRLTPGHSLYSVAGWSLDPLASALAEARLPLIVDFGRRHWSERTTPWDDIKTLCNRHRGLSVVLEGVTVGESRNAIALAEAASNFHIETHCFSVPDLYRLAGEAGVSRQLVFGTGMPVCAGECAVEMLRRADLDSAAMLVLSSGNARRVLDVEGPLPNAQTPAPFDTPLVDMHAHYGSWERTISTVKRPGDIVASMDRCGIEMMVGSSFAAIHGEMRAGNAQAAEIVSAYPDRLFAYCAVNPHWGDEVKDEIGRCFEETSGFVGFKFHCGLHAADLDHPGYVPALEYAHAHKLPVLVHGGGGWDTVPAQYPNASFILAHACAWDGVSQEGAATFAMARDVSNIYLDVAGSAAHRGALRALIDLIGVDNILFGSDFPMFDLAYEAGRVTLSTLSDAEKHAVGRANALRLFTRLPRRPAST